MTNSRLSGRFDYLATKCRPGLVTFLTAGDPNLETSHEIVRQLPGAGADIIELGMPFSDPMADGPIIQASGQRALGAGINIGKIFSIVTAFRDGDQETPIILMGYYNPVYIYGIEKFIKDAEAAGVDGLIIVDLPLEENEMQDALDRSSMDFIYLIAPTTDDDRLQKIVRCAQGFIYYVSVTGITGTKKAISKDVEAAVARLRQYTSLPIAVGFGIKSPEQAVQITHYADAAVVGSALVARVAENIDRDGKPTSDCVSAVLDLVGQLAEGIRSVSKRVKEDAAE